MRKIEGGGDLYDAKLANRIMQGDRVAFQPWDDKSIPELRLVDFVDVGTMSGRVVLHFAGVDAEPVVVPHESTVFIAPREIFLDHAVETAAYAGWKVHSAAMSGGNAEKRYWHCKGPIGLSKASTPLREEELTMCFTEAEAWVVAYTGWIKEALRRNYKHAVLRDGFDVGKDAEMKSAAAGQDAWRDLCINLGLEVSMPMDAFTKAYVGQLEADARLQAGDYQPLMKLGADVMEAALFDCLEFQNEHSGGLAALAQIYRLTCSDKEQIGSRLGVDFYRARQGQVSGFDYCRIEGHDRALLAAARELGPQVIELDVSKVMHLSVAPEQRAALTM